MAIGIIGRYANSYWVTVAVTLVMWIYLASAWNVIGGFLGQVSFGNAAFFGIGAYSAIYLASAFGLSPWIGMFVGAGLSAMTALAVGYLPFRMGLSPLVFALLTLAFSYMLLYGVSGVEALGGTNGLFASASGQSFWDFRFSDPVTLLVVGGVFTTVELALIQMLYAGRYGFYWRAIHDNEAAAAAMGIDVFRVKQLTFALSGFLTSFAGSFFAQNVGFIDPPSAFGIEITIFILLFAVVGGAGTMLGPLFGTMLLMPAGEWLRVKLAEAGSASANHLVYGVALMAAILLWPGGLVKALSRFGLSRGRLSMPTLGDGALPTAPASERICNDPLLEVREVSKRFGGLAALRNVTFEVPKGAIVGLIGPNGAGKTTLFSCLAGSQIPTSGTICFNGRRIEGMRPDRVCACGIGRTFQITQAFPSMTMSEVVFTAALANAGSADAAAIASQVLKDTGLWPRRDAVCASLTLAEQRRLGIARALAARPTLILLDEIMAGLTPREIDEAILLIRNIRDSGVTVLLIEHHIRAVMAVSDRIIVLDAGELIADGTPDQIKRNERVLEAYLGAPEPEEQLRKPKLQDHST
ncbi:hypothetical protein AC630_12200 [Bradyrhizobium sp. AS23.2]|nr:hypothetical protein AC630_12200 [Bradyrhizobium sp. AS23.2]